MTLLRDRLHLPTMLLLLTTALLLSSCATFNCTPLEKYIGGETDLIAFSYTLTDDLISRALPPLVSADPEMAILVTTFANNDNLKRTSKLGRILQEHISSRLVQQGYVVKEIKMASDLRVQEQSGETILSRDLSRLPGSQTGQAVLVGTYTYVNRTLYISSRLLDPGNSRIIAAGDYRLCMDDDILAMFGLQKDGTDLIGDPRRSWIESIFN